MKAPRYLRAFKNISKCGALKQNGGDQDRQCCEASDYVSTPIYSVLKYSVHNIQMLRNVQIEELYT